MKPQLIILSFILFILSSCSPASSGQLGVNENGCVIVTNNSTSDKITFIMKLDSDTASDAVKNYRWEVTVAPQESQEVVGLAGCPGKVNVSIVSAYLNAN
jgi:hypothetical protein